jgi:DNA ligase 1
LRGQPPEQVAAVLRSYFEELDAAGRFLLVKFIGGGFRVGVSKLLVTRALAAHAGLDAKLVAQRLMGYTDIRSMPSAARFDSILSGEETAQDHGQPYPFFLAHGLEGAAQDLGEISDWQAEWKYDGIRAQIVKRAGSVWIWSRGEELVTERFPEVQQAAARLSDGTVLDGELVVWKDNAPAPFALLQQRIGRKTVSKAHLANLPVKFLAYDLLELGGDDLRALPQRERRRRLEALQLDGFALSPVLNASSWDELAALRACARERGVEGLMLKSQRAAYGVGRTKTDGVWFKWKLDPMSIDCVLIYAQAGHGRRASVYTDYTFAVWNRKPQDQAEVDAVLDAITARKPAEPGALQLVAFAKAYSGLSDAEFKAVDAVIRKTTLEKFGPVRSVRPSLVFELGFEGINESSRHKSGIAVRFPRMLRQRLDKPLLEANTLDDLRKLMLRA